MKKRILSATLSLAMVFALAGRTAAVESPSIRLDGTALQMEVTPIVIDRTTYVCYWPVVQAMYPDAVATWENDLAVVRAAGLTMTIQLGGTYIEANGRYLYLDGKTVLVQDGNILVPVRALAKALGAAVAWDGLGGAVVLQSGSGPITPASEYYNVEDLKWLSHIIYAESGNQPLAGKIAVGNVVLNRVHSAQFPNTVYGVVFQRNQFTPVSNGSIYREPSEESILAAKLCLDGANTAGSSLYFVNPRVSPNSWASRSRPYVATIGAHAFFG